MTDKQKLIKLLNDFGINPLESLATTIVIKNTESGLGVDDREIEFSFDHKGKFKRYVIYGGHD